MEPWYKVAPRRRRRFGKAGRSIRTNDETFATVHGQKFVLEGELEGPSGRRLRVRTIWIIDRGQERPRLVTAYPG